MQSFINALEYLIAQTQVNLPLVLYILGGLWAFNIVNFIIGKPFNLLGIYPRTWHGLIGIPISPILHGNLGHLFFNSIPLFFLMNFILLDGLYIFCFVTLGITLISGTIVWIIGRSAFHIGASSLIMGYFSYLLIQAYRHPSAYSVILAILCIYYFGGLLLQLFPSDVQVSWEGHVSGFVAGILVAQIL